MDCHAYRLARAALWIQNGSLDHFITTDMRHVGFPINWELMLLWPMIFLKSDYLNLFPAFFSYFASLTAVSIFLTSLKLSIKRILWVVLILGSLPVVLLESTSGQSDLLIGFLLFSSFYLFYNAVKNNEKLPLFFSSLAYAIAVGAKSTAILFIPIFAIVFALIAVREKKKDFYKPVIKFIFYFIPGFLLLSSYNYILNYMSFGNVLGPSSIVNDHIVSGVKTFVSAFFLQTVYFADFSGIKPIENLNPDVLNAISAFFKTLGLKIADGVPMGIFEGLNFKIHEHHSSFGFLGYLLVFPMAIMALTRLRPRKNRTFYLSICGIFLLAFFLIVPLILGYSHWFIRFFTTAIILASPVLAFSYSKKNGFYKIMIALIVAFNYIAISLFSYQKPFFEVIALLPKFNSFSEFRDDLRLRSSYNFEVHITEHDLLNYLKQQVPDNSKIGLVFSMDDIVYPFFEENPTWNIYPVRYDRLFAEKNFDDYDYLIVSKDYQTVHLITDELEYNYHRDYRHRRIAFTEAPDAAKFMYLSHMAGIVFEGEGKPLKKVNIVEELKLSPHYEKIMMVFPKNSSRDRIFKIYKRIKE